MLRRSLSMILSLLTLLTLTACGDALPPDESPPLKHSPAQAPSSVSSPSPSPGDSAAAAETSPEPELTPVPSASADLLSGYADPFVFEVVVDGRVFSLPCPANLLLEDGWKLEGADTGTLKAGYYDSLWVTKDDQRLPVDIVNLSTLELPLEECLLGGLSASADAEQDSPGIELPGGIVLGASFDEVLAAYGPPTSAVAENSDGSRTARYGRMQNCLEIRAGADGIVEGIAYQNFGYVEFPDLPDALCPPVGAFDYEPPQELGDSWDSLSLRFGGELIRLPIPVAQLMEAGWIPTDNPARTLEAEGTTTMEMRRRSSFISLGIYNPGESDCTLCECLVRQIEYDDEDGRLPFELPGGITEDSGPDEILAAYGEPDDRYESDSGGCVSLTYGSAGDSLYFFYDTERDAITTMKLSCRPETPGGP